MTPTDSSAWISVWLAVLGCAGCATEANTLPEVSGDAEPAEANPKADDPASIAFTPFIDDVGARGTQEAREVFTTQKGYRDFFGHDAPSTVDFSTDWVVFYSAGAPKATNETSIKSIVLPPGSGTLEVTTSLRAKGACWVVGSLFVLAKFPRVVDATQVQYFQDDKLVDNCDVPGPLAADWTCSDGAGDPTFVASCLKTGASGPLDAQTSLAWTKVVPSGMCTAALTCPDGARVGCLGTSSCAATPSVPGGWVVCDKKRTLCAADAFVPDPGPSKPEALGWELAFVDEFDGAAIDRDLWTSNYFGIEADHVFIRDGKAVFQIAEDDPVTPWGGRVAALNTRDIFAQQYGWFEIRAKMATGNGKRGGASAFWMLPQNNSYLPSVDQGGFRPSNEPFEIDIFEQYTWSPTLNAHTLHAGRNPDFIPAGSRDHVEAFITQTYPFDHGEGFHTYAIEWTPEAVTWYIDGSQVQHSWLSSRVPFFIHLNLYQSPDVTDPDLTFPLELEVDYARIYRLPGNP